VQSPPHARPLAEGLGKESDLCHARGLILHIARGWFIHSSLPPASTDPPDSMSCPINTSTTPAISVGRWFDTAEWSTRHGVALAPYQLGQGTAGITGHCILMMCTRSAPAPNYAPRSPPRKQHDVGGLARVNQHPGSIALSRPQHYAPGSRLSRDSCPPRPLHGGAASAPTEPRPRAQSVHSGSHVRHHTHSDLSDWM
jgi:hypothetical protein